jgi:hypothetical protein
MTHISHRRLVVTLVGIMLIILAAGCGGSSTIPSGTATATSGAEPPQTLYAARLLADRRALDRGVLSYSRIGGLATATTASFEVTVTDVGNGPQLAQVTEFDGMNVYQQDVPTGGIVGVQIVNCARLVCTSESNLMQPVLEKGQQATWLWTITAGTPGPALITLRADTYDQGSTQTLSEEIINVNVKVFSTSAFDQQQSHKKIVAVAKNVYGGIEVAGIVAGAVLAVGGIVGWIIMMARKRKAGNRGGPAQPAQPHVPPVS